VGLSLTAFRRGAAVLISHIMELIGGAGIISMDAYQLPSAPRGFWDMMICRRTTCFSKLGDAF
jgi:hypothetical protein